MGYKRAKHAQHPAVSLLQLENVTSQKDAASYLGKRCVYVYRHKRADKKTGSKTRKVWGTIAKVHGNSGVVRARFTKPLPPRTFGATVRVMLFPSKI